MFVAIARLDMEEMITAICVLLVRSLIVNYVVIMYPAAMCAGLDMAGIIASVLLVGLVIHSVLLATN